MINPIKQIYDFNDKAGLLEKGYDDFLESSFQIEEALEGFDVSNIVHYSLPKPDLEDPNWVASISNPKDVSRNLLNLVKTYQDPGSLEWSIPPLSDVDRLDKACDAVVFAVGSMAKLGLNPSQITRALNIVMNANMAKLSCPKDEHGKLTKPANFNELYAPEPKLQALLDERK